MIQTNIFLLFICEIVIKNAVDQTHDYWPVVSVLIVIFVLSGDGFSRGVNGKS